MFDGRPLTQNLGEDGDVSEKIVLYYTVLSETSLIFVTHIVLSDSFERKKDGLCDQLCL